MTAESYLSSPNGFEQVRKHGLHKFATWAIYGEIDDPFGHAYARLLGIFTGTFENAVKAAVQIKGFVSFGVGGSVVEVRNYANLETTMVNTYSQTVLSETAAKVLDRKSETLTSWAIEVSAIGAYLIVEYEAFEDGKYTPKTKRIAL